MSTEQPSSTGAILYSHDETVAAITSYYELVARAHAITDRSELLHPPPEGWPQLNDPDVVAGFGFSDEALELIRHIPYFECSERVQILPDVEPHNYIERDLLPGVADRGKSIRRGEAEYGEDRTPPHLVLLGFIPPLREYGSDVYLDTKLGNVIIGNYHCNVQIGLGVESDAIYPEPDDNSYDDLFKDLDSDGEGSCYRISTFFAAC
ncbi:uncharacterized protein F4807DRAFT_424113, partial [Annulohypoxylon truncatum]|uniref:uncharacterized protein n=1 Tax=Annulohypoxylon truncatum TaxID=327061 RepID=UPI002007EF89